MRRQFSGYNPLSTEDWAKLQKANIVRRVLYPFGKGSASETPTPSFEPEYQAILDYATTQGYTLPSSSQQTLQNSIVSSLKSAGIWNDLDLFYVMATDGDSEYSRLNWKNPSSYRLNNADGSTNMTFETNKGWRPTTRLNVNNFTTNYNPAINATGFTRDDASRFVWDYDFRSGTGVYDGNAFNYQNTMLVNNSTNHHINNISNLPSAFNNTGVGFKMIQRTSSTNVNMYNNSSTPTSFTSASDPVYSAGAGGQRIWRAGAGQGENLLSFYGLGASLSGKESSLFNTITTYMSSI